MSRSGDPNQTSEANIRRRHAGCATCSVEHDARRAVRLQPQQCPRAVGRHGNGPRPPRGRDDRDHPMLAPSSHANYTEASGVRATGQLARVETAISNSRSGCGSRHHNRRRRRVMTHGDGHGTADNGESKGGGSENSETEHVIVLLLGFGKPSLKHSTCRQTDFVSTDYQQGNYGGQKTHCRRSGLTCLKDNCGLRGDTALRGVVAPQRLRGAPQANGYRSAVTRLTRPPFSAS